MFMTPTITGRHHPVRQSQRRRRGAHLALTRQPQEAQAGDDELVELLDLTEIKPVNEELAAAFSSRPTQVSDNLVSHANQANDACAPAERARSAHSFQVLFHASAAYQVEKMLSPQEMDACWADVVARIPLTFLSTLPTCHVLVPA